MFESSCLNHFLGLNHSSVCSAGNQTIWLVKQKTTKSSHRNQRVASIL